MRLCAQCHQNPQAWAGVTAPPGRCSECGRPFDLQGRPISDDAVTCPVHDPILASCPHSGADPAAVPGPSPSWLDEGADR